jgi:hypothetical protein
LFAIIIQDVGKGNEDKNTLEARSINAVDPNKSVSIKVWSFGRVYKMHKVFGNHWVEYRDLIDMMDHPLNIDIGLYCYQKGQQQLDLRSY